MKYRPFDKQQPDQYKANLEYKNFRDLEEYYNLRRKYYESKETFCNEERPSKLYKESFAELQSQIDCKFKSFKSSENEERPYQHIWRGEELLERILLRNSRTVSEGKGRYKYDQYMEKIGRVAENLLASFDVTKRRIVPSSSMYSSLWNTSTSQPQPENVVDPWADPELYSSENIPNSMDHLQNISYDDVVRAAQELSSSKPNYIDAWEGDHHKNDVYGTWDLRHRYLNSDEIPYTGTIDEV